MLGFWQWRWLVLDQQGLWRGKRSPPGWDSWLGGVQGLELKYHLAQLCPRCQWLVQVPRQVPFPAHAVVGASLPKKFIPGSSGPEDVLGWVSDLGVSPSHGPSPSCMFPNPDTCWAPAPAPNLPAMGLRQMVAELESVGHTPAMAGASAGTRISVGNGRFPSSTCQEAQGRGNSPAPALALTKGGASSCSKPAWEEREKRGRKGKCLQVDFMTNQTETS